MSLTETRAEIAKNLESFGYSVYSYPKESMIAPALVLVPGSPYVQFDTPTRRSVKFQLTIMVAANDNQAALVNLETIIDEVSDILPTWFAISDFTQPQIVEIGSTSYLTTDINIQTTII